MPHFYGTRIVIVKCPKGGSIRRTNAVPRVMRNIGVSAFKQAPCRFLGIFGVGWGVVCAMGVLGWVLAGRKGGIAGRLLRGAVLVLPRVQTWFGTLGKVSIYIQITCRGVIIMVGWHPTIVTRCARRQAGGHGTT